MKNEYSRSKKEAFDNKKIQAAYKELSRIIEKKKIDVMKLFL